MDLSNAANRLAPILKELKIKNHEKLNELKSEQDNYSRPDFIWHYLLQSFATMGNSAGWKGLIGNQDNYNLVRFENLLKLSDTERMKQITTACWQAKIRMPDKKAEYIETCFQKVQELGGLTQAKAELDSKQGYKAKIKFLRTFHGIGPKYARNIMMDVYHIDFRETIAIDVRIQKITDKLGLKFQNYDAHEQFYIEVAHAAGLNGWELDRILYWNTDEVLCKLTNCE